MVLSSLWFILLRTWFPGFSYSWRLFPEFSWFCFHQEIWNINIIGLKTTVFLRRIKIRRAELPVTPKNFRDLKNALIKNKGKVNIHVQNSLFLDRSSSLRPESYGFTFGEWFIGYNFGTDYGAESNFGKHIKNLLSLTFGSLNIVFISHVIRNVTIFLKILI